MVQLVELYGKHISPDFFKLPKEEFVELINSPNYLKGMTEEQKIKVISDCYDSVNGITLEKKKPKTASKAELNEEAV